jgi:3-oxoacyl-[acyl-carrier-protein] synthase-3
MMRAANTVLDRCGLTAQDIKCVIPHQANIRIIEAMADRMDLTMDRFHINLDKYGNTSAAAVAIALDEAARTDRFEKGDPILLVVFGGGLTFASSVIEW